MADLELLRRLRPWKFADRFFEVLLGGLDEVGHLFRHPLGGLVERCVVIVFVPVFAHCAARYASEATA